MNKMAAGNKVKTTGRNNCVLKRMYFYAYLYRFISPLCNRPQ